MNREQEINQAQDEVNRFNTDVDNLVGTKGREPTLATAIRRLVQAETALAVLRAKDEWERDRQSRESADVDTAQRTTNREELDKERGIFGEEDEAEVTEREVHEGDTITTEEVDPVTGQVKTKKKAG